VFVRDAAQLSSGRGSDARAADRCRHATRDAGLPALAAVRQDMGRREQRPVPKRLPGAVRILRPPLPAPTVPRYGSSGGRRAGERWAG
jgi:hypothetical protein